MQSRDPSTERSTDEPAPQDRLDADRQEPPATPESGSAQPASEDEDAAADDEWFEV